jgi:hypothetical protein
MRVTTIRHFMIHAQFVIFAREHPFAEEWNNSPENCSILVRSMRLLRVEVHANEGSERPAVAGVWNRITNSVPRGPSTLVYWCWSPAFDRDHAREGEGVCRRA